ncbi:DsrH/TusB family sulfur metabolism protein [Pseudoalteromonas tunicata]|jgi:sulfur relay protein TusB/DsrH|uniref:Uncharacterized protein n=1 Tax=Pseudoalteromonas tunicata D2 TaxID=87626 RepID=A4CC74_9GAMM|nr:DsrH/TusB family sulfur metabolism protein [Pseudoalteromonas tunicata]ATC94510.1 tRNA 2-thiouridine synthesizing protein B [Pseudoalteromonas tunicata]AXT30236.1 tRNA 2-thiouridine-synthesizing protein [Pseudoalteromonas tunicata]EAR27961.1 hypothetical protein PTD2_19105 [Pseudoalteromonas tunicata D2]MDP5212189.1 DsrH/TusB family sulfur metabolism protein [Pseudoalteromonas tunicata]
MTLHIFNQALSAIELNKVKSLINEKDTLLLTQDACYSAKYFKSLHCEQMLLLASDAQARLNQDELVSLSLIEFSDWVELTLSHQSIITW